MTHRHPPHTPPGILGETVLTICEATRLFPGVAGGAKRINRTSLIRRIASGTRNPATGEVVRLEAVRDGNRWLTSVEAITRYHTAMGRQSPLTKAETPVRRRKRAERTRAELDAAGI